MSFIPDSLSLIVQPTGGVGIRFFSYRTDDAVATVTGAGYFVRVREFAVRDYDLVFVVPANGDEEPYIITIEIDAAGNGTGVLSPADTAVQPGDLGSAAYAAVGDFATAAQGGTADTALQPDDIGVTIASAAQGALADTALQPSDIGTAAVEDVEYFASAAQGNPLNIGRDKLTYSVIANLIRLTGDAAYNTLYGVAREVQYPAIDETNGYWYTTHDNDEVPNLAIITRYPINPSGVDCTQDAVSLPTEEFGHQGLYVEPDTGKLWSTDGTNKLAAIRFDFAAGLGPQNKQQYVLFEDEGNIAGSWNNDISCFNNGSNRWIIAHGKIVGEETAVFRFWDKAALIAGGPGDYTNAWVKEVYAQELYHSSTFPIQGSCSLDDRTLIAWSGGNGYSGTEPRRMYKYDIDSGAVLEADHNVMIGAIEAASDGTGISYEPEGMVAVTVLGIKRACVGVRSGSSLTPSTYRVLMLGANDRGSVNIQASGKAFTYSRLGVPVGGVELNTTAYKILAYGAGVNLRLGTLGIDNWEVESTAGAFRPQTTDLYSIGQSSRRPLAVWAKSFTYSTGVIDTSGTGSPEGVTTASIGSTFKRTDGTAGALLYLKETGAGNTGWVGSRDLTATATAAAIAAIANAINTTDKRTGKVVWDSTNNRAMRASGTTAASPWHVLDGSVTVTPA